MKEKGKSGRFRKRNKKKQFEDRKKNKKKKMEKKEKEERNIGKNGNRDIWKERVGRK